MKRLLMLSIFLVPAGFLAATGCRTPPEADVDQPVQQLQAYEVPPSYKSDVRAQLRYVLSGSENAPLGRVTEGPGNTLLVVAPATIQAGVRQMLKEIGEMAEAPPTPPLLRLTYWVVAGRPLERAASGRPFAVTGPARLDEIERALSGIAEAQGPTEFRLLERIELSSVGSELARASGRVANVRQRTTMSEGRVVADVDLSLRTAPNELSTRVVLEPGQYLVLGQAGFGGRPQDAFGADDASDVTLYYVMASDH